MSLHALGVLFLLGALPSPVRAAAEMPDAYITGFFIEPGAAQFGQPVPAGSPMALSVSGYGHCRVRFMVKPRRGGAGPRWRELAKVEGALPLSARFEAPPSGEYWMSYLSTCSGGKFENEFRVRVVASASK